MNSKTTNETTGDTTPETTPGITPRVTPEDLGEKSNGVWQQSTRREKEK